MEALVPVVLVVTGMLLALGYRGIERDDRLRKVAGRLGSSVRRSGLWGAAALSGTLHGQRIEATYQDRRRRTFLDVRLWPQRPLPGLVLRGENLLSRLGIQTDIRTGDAAFDARFQVQGSDAAAVIGLLDAPTRQAIIFLDRVGLRLEADGSAVRLVLSSSAQESDIADRIKQLVNLGRRLSRDGTPKDHLLSTLRTDADPEVRMRALDVLVEHCGAGEPDVQAALLAAVRPDDWPLALRAASALGAGALGPLAEILPRCPLELCLEATEVLAGIGGPGAVSLLRAQLADRHRDGPAAAALATLGDRDSLPAVLSVLRKRRRDPESIRAIAAGLEKIADPQAGGPLLELFLDPGIDPALHPALVRALGACGGLEAVPHLREAATPALGGELKAAAQAAVARIRERLGVDDADQGRLAVAEGEVAEGGLSPAGAGEGSLAVSEGEVAESGLSPAGAGAGSLAVSDGEVHGGHESPTRQRRSGGLR